MKPTYKISASLLNSYFYYLNNPSNKNYEGFVNRLKNVFETNFFLERGNQFEADVFEGKHDIMSELVKDLPKQVWASKTIEREDYNIRIAGIMDVIDEDKKRIYDIKRVSKFTKDKYDNSTQHLIYFYLRPEMTDFYYLAGVGRNELERKEVAHYKKPDDKKVEETVLHIIDNFYKFLKDNNLWSVYTENQQAKIKTSQEEGK
jgi:hypothetical protein